MAVEAQTCALRAEGGLDPFVTSLLALLDSLGKQR